MRDANIKKKHYPSLYQINIRVWLTELSQALGKKASLDDIPDAELDRVAQMGVDSVWLLSVWCTGTAGRTVSRNNPDWRRDFQETLPDLREDDIAGSGFAITGYAVHPDLGGDEALARLRLRLANRKLKLMLDFVPNHMGQDHPWVESHPEYFVAGTEDLLKQQPQNYIRIQHGQDSRILAYGRDPYFSGWPDTLQLDYSNPATQTAMMGELIKIAGQCDGVRCDMAMLVLPEVFERTWGRRPELFWPKATSQVRKQSPDFCFMAEVYWDMEWTMQQQGFDYAYDKCLYDRLRAGHARAVRQHLCAGLDYQNKLARFLENHDEPRAAATFSQAVHQAAAIITYFSPGLRFFHQGQFEGRIKRISPHLVRAPNEPLNQTLEAFYKRLLSIIQQPIFREGVWRLLECAPAWDGNGTWDSFLIYAWEGAEGARALVAVNYAPHASQCYVRLPFTELEGKSVRLCDTISSASYDRNGDELVSKGLFLDLAAWGYHVFDVKLLAKNINKKVTTKPLIHS